MKLFCQQQGNNQAPALIMAHGVFGSHDNLGAIAPILEIDCYLYRLDLRNHGRSPHAATMSFTDMANDVLELIVDNNIQQAAVLGHSLGGKVMMELATNHPERVSRLIVADIAPVEYPAHHDPILEGLQSIKLDGLRSRHDADEQLKSFVGDAPTQRFLLKNLQRDEQGNFYWRLNLPAIASQYGEMRKTIGNGKVYSGPTLFIRGGLSKYIQERNFDAIYKQFPNAKIETIANASHWLHAEQPQQFADLVTQFLTGEN